MFIDYGIDITPTRVISAYRLLKSPIGVVTQQAGRKCWGIALKFGGRTCYTQDGKQFLSDDLHVVLLPKGSSYTWTCTEQGECLLINFDALDDITDICSFEISDNSFIRTAFTKIERCLSIESPANRLECMQQLYGILLFICKSGSKKYIPRDKQHILAPAIDYIVEKYADPNISNDFLAALCGISTVYFRKSFETVYGTSPIRYLHNLRISKAKAILLGDCDSIGQIAKSVGYSSVYHFSKMFKSHTGVSPSEYAKAPQ